MLVSQTPRQSILDLRANVQMRKYPVPVRMVGPGADTQIAFRQLLSRQVQLRRSQAARPSGIAHFSIHEKARCRGIVLPNILRQERQHGRAARRLKHRTMQQMLSRQKEMQAPVTQRQIRPTTRSLLANEVISLYQRPKPELHFRHFQVNTRTLFN